MTTSDLKTTENDISRTWDRGDLTDLEIAAVCMALILEPGIDLTCKEALRHWLDPDRPSTGAAPSV